MKKAYMTPVMDQIEFQQEDILTASLTNLGNSTNECDGAIWGAEI